MLTHRNAGSSPQVESSPNLKLPLRRTARRLPALSRCGEAEQQASWPPRQLVFAHGCRRVRPGLVPTCACSSLSRYSRNRFDHALLHGGHAIAALAGYAQIGIDEHGVAWVNLEVAVQ